MKYSHYLEVYNTPMHQNWHHINWNTIDSFCNYSFLRVLLHLAHICLFIWEAKVPVLESHSWARTVAGLSWTAIALQWWSGRSHIYEPSLTTFAVKILSDKQYWCYEEVTQNTTWELILQSYSDCIWRWLKKMRSHHLSAELWSTQRVLIYENSNKNNKHWVLATQRQRILGCWVSLKEYSQYLQK